MTDTRELLAHPTALKLYVMRTGSVHMSGNIHFNKKSPRFKSMPRDDRFNPVLAFLLEHPEKGRVLMDTGLDASFCQSDFGNFGALLGRVVKTKAEKGSDVVSQLATIDLSPSEIPYVIMSHMHLDHASSLPRFNQGSEVYVDSEELAAARSPMGTAGGYIKRLLDGLTVKTFKYSGSFGPFDQACDFFDDNSLLVLRAPGHTKGNVAVLLNANDGPILLTFDAAHRKANIDEGIPPKGDYNRATASLNSIKSLLAELPDTRVIYGHDPDQLKDLELLPSFYT